METVRAARTRGWAAPPRSLAWAGIVGPVLFTAAFLAQGAFRRNDYDPLAEPVSALEAGPYGWVQQVNLVLFGLLTIAFAVGASPWRTTNPGGPSRSCVVGRQRNRIAARRDISAARGRRRRHLRPRRPQSGRGHVLHRERAGTDRGVTSHRPRREVAQRRDLHARRRTRCLRRVPRRRRARDAERCSAARMVRLVPTRASPRRDLRLPHSALAQVAADRAGAGAHSGRVGHRRPYAAGDRLDAVGPKNT
jgi:Protein of unknown function (DUF998)